MRPAAVSLEEPVHPVACVRRDTDDGRVQRAVVEEGFRIGEPFDAELAGGFRTALHVDLDQPHHGDLWVGHQPCEMKTTDIAWRR